MFLSQGIVAEVLHVQDLPDEQDVGVHGQKADERVHEVYFPKRRISRAYAVWNAKRGRWGDTTNDPAAL